MTDFMVIADVDARSIRKKRRSFNDGRVLVLNTPPCLSDSAMIPSFSLAVVQRRKLKFGSKT